uniref:Uncharacterized protein n=1 Tax=Siphoviridae sp. ctFIm6 TaxID=2827818 RepID=A0A8S5SJA0_9CAUD|nr:MAG TPA: hypothetical protein [Siphoviridae sp. ctFIm6]
MINQLRQDGKTEKSQQTQLFVNWRTTLELAPQTLLENRQKKTLISTWQRGAGKAMRFLAFSSIYWILFLMNH